MQRRRAPPPPAHAIGGVSPPYSLTMGANPFMSFLVLPLRSNCTSIMSPSTEITVPGPNVLWLTASPAAKTAAAAAASGLRCSTAGAFARGRAEPAPDPNVAGPPSEPPATRPASGLIAPRRCTPGVERV